MPKPNEEKKLQITEKLKYRTRCNKWRELKVSGDIGALAQLTGRTRATVSKALNHGRGGLDLLSQIDEYFQERERNLPNGTDYLPNERKNYIL